MHQVLATAAGALLAAGLFVACSTSDPPAPMQVMPALDATAAQAVPYFGDVFASAQRAMVHAPHGGEAAPTF